MNIPLLPSKKQWMNWRLPSRLTAISTYVGIISLLVVILNYSYIFVKYLNDQKLNNIITKNEWILKNVLTTEVFIKHSYSKESSIILSREISDVNKGNNDGVALLFLKRILVDGVLTYKFKTDNTYYVNSIFEKNIYSANYRIKKERKINI